MRALHVIIPLVILAALVGLAWWWIDEQESDSVTEVAGESSIAKSSDEEASAVAEGAADVRRESSTVPEPEPDDLGTAPRTGGVERTIRVLDGSSKDTVVGAAIRWVGFSELNEEDRRLVRDSDATIWRVVERRGHRARSNREGEVTLAHGPERLFAVARHEGRWGFTAWRFREQDPLVLRVHPDGDLLIRAVDVTGEPQAGVAVAWYVLGRTSDWAAWHGVTAARDGIARLAHGAAWMKYKSSGGSMAAAGFDFPMRPFEKTHVALDEPPPFPVDLTLPATARLVVRIYHPSGEPSGEHATLFLTVHDSSAADAKPDESIPSFRRNTEEGRVEFPHVGLGLSLNLRARLNQAGAEYAEKRIEGPTEAGEEMIVELYLPVGRAVLAGRLLDPRGHPIRSARLSAMELVTTEIVGREIGLRRSSMGSMRTDEDGRFEHVLPRAEESGSKITVTIVHYPPDGGPTLRVVFDDVAAYSPGVTELGELSMEAETLVAAGIVTDEVGKAVVGAQVEARFEGGYATGKADSEGKFALRSFGSPLGEVLLRASATGRHLELPIRTALGDRAVRLVLRAN